MVCNNARLFWTGEGILKQGLLEAAGSQQQQLEDDEGEEGG